MSLPLLNTDRLTLRGFHRDDAPAVQRLAGNHEVAKTTLNIPHPYLDGMAEAWIETHQPLWQSRTGLVYAVVLSEGDLLLGAVSLRDIKNDQGELGYWIGEPFWGQGFCTEAAGALIQFAFAQLGLRRVTSRHLISNPASGRVMTKIGMSHIGSGPQRDRQGQETLVELFEICQE